MSRGGERISDEVVFFGKLEFTTASQHMFAWGPRATFGGWAGSMSARYGPARACARADASETRLFAGFFMPAGLGM
jgi:hypothetical protein